MKQAEIDITIKIKNASNATPEEVAALIEALEALKKTETERKI